MEKLECIFTHTLSAPLLKRNFV